jgi:hypothetical protein
MLAIHDRLGLMERGPWGETRERGFRNNARGYQPRPVAVSAVGVVSPAAWAKALSAPTTPCGGDSLLGS